MTEQPDAVVPAPRPGADVAESSASARPRVVVGVDGSPGSRTALRYALTAAVERDADLDVESAVPIQLYWMGTYPVSPEVLDDVQRDTRERVRAVVDEVRADASARLPDERVHVFVTGGGAAPALVQRAQGADLLVVGSRGRGAVRSAVLGSVALHCVAAAPCPVVVVHEHTAAPAAPGEPAGGAVVVGVDGSPASAAALRAAAGEAVRAGVRLDVVGAYSLADYWSDMYDVLVPSAEAIHEAIRTQTEAMVAQLSRTASALPPEVHTVVVEGFPAEILLERARGARLLVVGGRGHGAIRGLLLGSVALQCVLHAPCAVEVVPTHGGVGPAEPARAEVVSGT
jgi:nucleotide-binding universal stress UspA family protein